MVARVDELPSSAEPCRVGASGKAYLGAHDGDHELSQLEVQALMAARETPVSDTVPVPGTGASDLDADLLAGYLRSRSAGLPRLATTDDAEVLRRTGVSTDAGELSVAGLLAMGTYPQQHLPMAVVRASIAPRRGDPPSVRATDSRPFDGPLPTMLEETVAWVSRSTTTALVTGADGHVRDAPEIPPAAVRELVADALIHRDLGLWALTQATTLTISGAPARRAPVARPTSGRPWCGWLEAAADQGRDSLEICPACGFQPGHHDRGGAALITSAVTWRALWVLDGTPWRSADGPPAGWDPIALLEQQLAAAEHRG